MVMTWWEQKALDMVGMWMAVGEAEQMKGEEKMNGTRTDRDEQLSCSKL